MSTWLVIAVNNSEQHTVYQIESDVTKREAMDLVSDKLGDDYCVVDSLSLSDLLHYANLLIGNETVDNR